MQRAEGIALAYENDALRYANRIFSFVVKFEEHISRAQLVERPGFELRYVFSGIINYRRVHILVIKHFFLLAQQLDGTRRKRRDFTATASIPNKTKHKMANLFADKTGRLLAARSNNLSIVLCICLA